MVEMIRRVAECMNDKSLVILALTLIAVGQSLRGGNGQ
jgi:hypothetical protein